MRTRMWLCLAGVPFVVGGCSSHPTDGGTIEAVSPSPASLAIQHVGDDDDARPAHQLLPTGDFITPTAARGSLLHALNPEIPGEPNFRADHATSTVTSPDGKTLLILTSGYNLTVFTSGPNLGSPIPDKSGEWVFVYDISSNPPAKKQVLKIPNSFAGIAFNPSGREFYVAGGQDDNVHVFASTGGSWAESGAPISLGHVAGLGLRTAPQSAGIAVNQSGTQLVVANYENDSISIVTLATRAVRELDLRPGKAVASPKPGVAGGEFPFWVAVKGDSTAYVSSQRDRELAVVDLTVPGVTKRITVGSQPNKMILNKDQSRLFVANATSDTVSIVDTSTDSVVETVSVTAPPSVFANATGLKGANPNGLALSPDEGTLYVTNGATNSVAVVRLESDGDADVVGLIPTGWYPTSVSTSADGRHLYVVNAKSVPGPACKDIVESNPDGGPPPYRSCWNGNQYVWQLETAGFLSLPTPSRRELRGLTHQVAENNHFDEGASDSASQDEADETMAFLRSHIQHVIYIIKENRTYDQVLGDLGAGNGDPTLTMFPEEITPNLHALAKQYVTLDAFLDTGETSGVGWNWTMAAHSTDAIERNQPINYGKGGLTYDWEGTNRNVNVGLATVAERVAAMAYTPTDPDLLPGAVDVSAPDAPGSEAGTGYLWDTALRGGLTVRNYGAFLDLTRYFLPSSDPHFIPRDKDPFAAGHRQAFPTKAALMANTDLYYRGYDNAYPDYWRYREWKREFDGFVSNKNLPSLEFVRLHHDHFGSFGSALAGLNTPLLQMADNDAAVGAVVAAVAASPYASSTLVFVIEDDAQDGPDHVDAHRSTAFVVGPYVKKGVVISTPYNTISMVRTIETVLGLDALGLYDGLARPMSEVFDPSLAPAAFTYASKQSDILGGTTVFAKRDATKMKAFFAALQRGHDGAYWVRAMQGQDFSVEDHLDVERFNRALWAGLMGSAPYPTTRSGG